MSLETDREPVEVRDWRDEAVTAWIHTRRYTLLANGFIRCVLPYLGCYRVEPTVMRAPGDWRKVKRES